MTDTAMMARAGRSTVSAGAYEALRMERDRSLAVMPGYPEYYDSVIKGMVFSAGTAASGVAPGAVIGTTAAFSLFNPLGSGYNLVVLQTTMGYLSGTLGAGVIHYVANTNPAAAASTGTACTKVNNFLGGASGVGQPLTTVTLPVTPTIVRPFVSLQASLASTAIAPWQVLEDLRGSIIVAPGCTLSLEGTTASGSTPLVLFGMTWMEVAV